jgi:hypothetical protein
MQASSSTTVARRLPLRRSCDGNQASNTFGCQLSHPYSSNTLGYSCVLGCILLLVVKCCLLLRQMAPCCVLYLYGWKGTTTGLLYHISDAMTMTASARMASSRLFSVRSMEFFCSKSLHCFCKVSSSARRRSRFCRE